MGTVGSTWLYFSQAAVSKAVTVQQCARCGSGLLKT